MDWVQLSQGYRAATRKQCTINYSVPRFPGVPGNQLIDLRRMKG